MDSAGFECFQVAVQEIFWDTWIHSSAGLFISKQRHQLRTLPSPQRFEPASPRGFSCPGLHLRLPPSHHQGHLTLSEVLSVYWYRKGSLCLRSDGLRTVRPQLSRLGAGRIQGPNP